MLCSKLSLYLCCTETVPAGVSPKTLSASSGFSVALYFNSNPRCSPDPGPPLRHIRPPPPQNPTKVTTSLQPLLSSQRGEGCSSVLSGGCEVATGVSIRKQRVFTVTESQPFYIYAVLNICLLMESGLTHLTQNITHFLRVSLFSLSLSLSRSVLWLHWTSCSPFFMSLAPVCKICSLLCTMQLFCAVLLVLHTHRLRARLHFSEPDCLFSPRAAPRLVMCRLQKHT